MRVDQPWSGDPDGIAEPLVNALRAAQRVGGPALAPPRRHPFTGQRHNVTGVVT